jgi:RNA polymerase sigma factor (TIGR02999 family)
MRRILAEQARRRKAAKRGEGVEPVSLDAAPMLAEADSVDFADLDEALKRLTMLDARQGQLVELRFFGGLSIEETAEVMKLSPATIKREWSSARAWLRRELES